MSTYPLQIQGRPDSSRLAGVASVALTGSLAGFLIASYLPGYFGVSSRVITVPFRGLLLILLLYTGYRWLDAGQLRFRISVTSLLAVFFWTAYCLKFIVDVALLQIHLGTPSPAGDMTLYLFGMSLPAFVVFYLIRDVNLYRKALIWTMLGLGACCLVSMIRTRTAQDVAIHGTGYDANEILNHIGYGHMGVTAAILGLFVFLRIDRIRRPWYLRLLGAGIACAGGFTILASSSRGALVAGIVLLPAVVYMGLRRGSKILTIVMVVVFGVVLSATSTYLTRNGVKLERQLEFATAYGLADPSIRSRDTMLRDALREYEDHPWVGDYIVERNTLSYPHNAIAEAFMATGTFGGAAFALLVLIAIRQAFRLIRRNPAMAWISLCFYQQLIGSMFSGGLYNNAMLWGMMAIMLGVDLPAARRRKHPAAGRVGSSGLSRRIEQVRSIDA
jgi:O-antigen ligase